MNPYYQVMVPRLNGEHLRCDLPRLRRLVRKGVAGFIIFGGALAEVRQAVAELQQEAALPLIISSDLERGLGQQLTGGTLMPPAMAFGALYKKFRARGREDAARRLLNRAFRAVAQEARYAGINTIFAPVLDINTNPKNPIIAVRAFGEEPNTVSALGLGMIGELQRSGLAACAKHFPGHGDTSVDSHIRLPVLKQERARLRRYELRPFQAAVEAGVAMMMLGHLSVPALDASGIPVSFSDEAVRFIRREMGYEGLLVTDALNMGGIGRFSEEEAACRALQAGVDILLHPSDPGRVAAWLREKRPLFDPSRLIALRRSMKPAASAEPDFGAHNRLAGTIASEAATVVGRFRAKGRPLLVILDDDAGSGPAAFGTLMGTAFPDMRILVCRQGEAAARLRKKQDEFLVVAIFSETKAWKGGASSWLRGRIRALSSGADLFISFGSPYLLDPVRKPKLFLYWDAPPAQAAACSLLAGA